jgi:hypothetical protein
MLATGFVVYDPDGVVSQLREAAAEVLQAGPDPSATQLQMQRYGAATLLEDALDIASADPEMCRMLLANAVEEAIRYRFWAAGRWQPRHKDLLRSLADLDPQLAHVAHRFYRATDHAEHITLADEIVHHSVGERGFFEWELPAEQLDQ